MMKRPLSDNIFTHVILAIFSLFALFPIIWICIASFLESSQVFTMTQNIDVLKNATVDNYTRLFTDKQFPFMNWMLTSTIAGVGTTLFGIFFSTTAAFSFSHFRFVGRKVGLVIFLFTQMFPGTILLVALYDILNYFNLLNMFGLILAYSTTAIPFCVWMLKSYFDTIPKDINEAAMIDGLNPYGIFFKIMLPLALPGIAVTSFFCFITAWNEFLYANHFLQTDTTVAVGLKKFVGYLSTSDYGMFCAGTVLSSLPIIIFFVFAQRWIISGLTAGSVKA